MNTKLNLLGFHGHERGISETSKIITLLTAGNGFKVQQLCSQESRPHKYRQDVFRQVFLIAPFEYQAIAHCSHPMLGLCDNGGELNVWWVNRDESLRSIPTQQSRCAVNAETIFKWIIETLEGQTPNYLEPHQDPFSEEDYAAMTNSKEHALI